MNRMANCRNPYQGKAKKVLCVCSAGLLRSPTAALVLSQEPYNFNTRACGLVQEFALIPLDMVLIEWADEIVCMEEKQHRVVVEKTEKLVLCLAIDDDYQYRDPQLMKLIQERYDACQELICSSLATEN